MSDISIYILSVVGVVVLSVVLDMILINGSMAKYIKSIMGFILIFVIASPIPKILKNKIDLSFFSQTSFEINEDYYEVIKNQQQKILVESLEKELSQNGFKNVHIQIWADFENNTLKINYIFVDLSDLVISNNNEHINKYEAIKTLLIEKTGIEEERLVFDD